MEIPKRKERTVEQAIQDMIRPGSSRSITTTAIRQQSIELIKGGVIAKRNLENYAVTHGVTKSAFFYAVALDGEAVDTGPEIEVSFVSPLAPGRTQAIEDLKRENQVAGPKGRKLWCVAALPGDRPQDPPGNARRHRQGESLLPRERRQGPSFPSGGC